MATIILSILPSDEISCLLFPESEIYFLTICLDLEMKRYLITLCKT